jgi:LytS/YehU family sensor histidine kinase
VTSPPPGPVPGFPIESILAGLLGGLIALTIIRRRRKL